MSFYLRSSLCSDCCSCLGGVGCHPAHSQSYSRPCLRAARMIVARSVSSSVAMTLLGTLAAGSRSQRRADGL
uniref:Uncharacterized protein n=1 Tax=uncultured marine virus TaxID=186617 RepID=A0A0F7L592_9VIRU|nr:hypothetical protein [uncultured marine virus]